MRFRRALFFHRLQIPPGGQPRFRRLRGGAAQQGFEEIWRLRKGFDWPRAGAFLVKPLQLVESVKINLFGAARRWTYAKSESGKGGFLVRPLLSEYIF